METSDSECFESADESFYSDDDADTTTIISNKMKNLKLQDSKNDESVALESKGAETSAEVAIKQEKEEEEANGKESKTVKKSLDNTVDPINEEALETADEKEDNKVHNIENIVKQDALRTTENNTENTIKEENFVTTGTKVQKFEKAIDEVSIATKSKVLKTENTVTEEISVATGKTENAIKEETPAKEEFLVATEKEDENLWNDDEGWGDFSSETDPSVYDNTQLPSDLKKGKLVSKYVPDEDKWEFDSWEPLGDEKAQDNSNTVQSSWGGWGGWGVTSILSTATQGVSTLTSQVSQGLSTVIESSMGVPDPEELARINQQEFYEQLNDNERTAVSENNNPSLSFGLGNLVSGVSQITRMPGVSQITKIVETTGTKVINSGLVTLETIGKKTAEILQEGDPGLKKKRAFLQISQDKPVLSQLLREAKEKAEEENKIFEQKHSVKKANYESIFDDHQGLVHLEALEMLSRQCDIKLQTVLETYSGDILKETQETMEQVKELCEIPDEEEEEALSTEEIKNRLENAVSEIGIAINYNKLVSTWQETEEWFKTLNLSVCSEGELHQQAIETLAQLTAIAVEQFHKGGELLLVKEHRSTADEADSLVQ